jgi:hypothetical protein
LYSYVRNNPIKWVDYDGHKDQPEQQRAVLNDGKTITIYQRTVEATDLKDENGNKIGQITTETITYAKYDISSSGPPVFVEATQMTRSVAQDGTLVDDPIRGNVSQDKAEAALGGASKVYDDIASHIRTDGRIRFVGVLGSGIASAPGIAGGIVRVGAAAQGGQWLTTIREGGKLLVEVAKEVAVHMFSEGKSGETKKDPDKDKGKEPK